MSGYKAEKLNIIARAMAEYTGSTDYNSDNDRTSYSCDFCPAEWERLEFQPWWDDEIKSDHMDVRLEKHEKTCPVYIARELIGLKPNADPVVCAICGAENWNNKSGWNGTEEEYNLYWDSRPHPPELSKEVKSTCCQECEAREMLYRHNRFDRKREERRQELAQPGQLEKEREATRASLQQHYDQRGIQRIVEWSDDCHGFIDRPAPPTI